MSHNTPNDDFTQQKESILAELKELGVGYIIASYSGSNDSGQLEDIATFKPRPESEKFEPDIYAPSELDLDELEKSRLVDIKIANQVKQILLGNDIVKLTDRIEMLMWEAIDFSGNSGWENNDGGDGTLILDVAAGTCILNHGNCVSKTTYEEHEL